MRAPHLFNAPVLSDAQQVGYYPQKSSDAMHSRNRVLIEGIFVVSCTEHFLHELDNYQANRATKRTPRVLEFAEIDSFEAQKKYTVTDTRGLLGA